MAPNLKKISLLVDDSFLDASSFLAVKGQEGGAVRDVQSQPSQSCVDGNAAPSYWDWPAPTIVESPPAADLFSAEHLQSNLIHASAERAASKSGKKEDEEPIVVVSHHCVDDREDYWAERREPKEQVVTAIKVPQHHPLNVQVSSDDYWRDARGERMTSDAYWSTTITKVAPPSVPRPSTQAAAAPVRVCADTSARELSDRYWDESSRRAHSYSDLYWNTGCHPATDRPSLASTAGSGVSRASPAELQDSHSRWVWSHEPTESDRYWAWESPTIASSAPALRTC
jgi:hypothetical protein